MKEFLAVAAIALLLALGWNEPLRYRFMSAKALEKERNPVRIDAPVAVSERPASSQWHPSGTALDRAPYKTTNEGLEYTTNYDARRAGARTEAEVTPNKSSGAGSR